MSDWFSAERHAERAHELYRAGDWREAERELRQAIDINPHESQWHFGLGLTLDAQQRYDAALAAYREASRLDPEDIDALLHLGLDLLRTRQPIEAIAVLERVNGLDRDCEPAYCHRIGAYAQLGDHDRAEQMFYLARQCVEKCAHCYAQMGDSLLARGELDRAIWCWGQVLEIDPRRIETHSSLAQAWWLRGQLGRARAELVERLRREPGHVPTLMNLGGLLMEMDRCGEAAEKFRRVIELDPGFAEAHLKLGELALAGSHLDAAEQNFELARRLKPDLPGVHLRLAEVARLRRRHDEFHRWLELEGQIASDDPQLALDLAASLIEAGRPVDAVDRLDAILALDDAFSRRRLHAQPTHAQPTEDDPKTQEPGVRSAPRDPHAASPSSALPAHTARALSPGEAATSLQALDRETRATALLFRGVAQLQLGRHAAGVADCRQSLRLMPQNRLAMHNLCLAYLEAGRLRRARCWLRRAERLAPAEPWLAQIRRRIRLQQLRQFVSAARGWPR